MASGRRMPGAAPSGEALAIGLYRLIQAWPEDGRYIRAAAHNDGVEILLDPAALPGAAVETVEQARAIVWTAAARTAWGESPWCAIRRALEHPHRFDDGEPARVTVSTMCWLRLGVADIPEAYSWVLRPSLEDAWREEWLIDGFCVRLARRARTTGRKLRNYRPVDLVGPDGTAESWLWVANLHLFEDTLAARAQLPEGIWRNIPPYVHRVLVAWPPDEKALFAWHPSLLLVPPLVADPKLGIALRLPGVPPDGVQGAFEAALREAEKGTPVDALQRWLARLTPDEAKGLAVLQGLGR